MIKNVIGVPFQALYIIFEMLSQKSSHKRVVKKISSFELQNTFYFIFLHLDPLLHQCIILSFFVQIE
jgi:hypothetical protein